MITAREIKEYAFIGILNRIHHEEELLKNTKIEAHRQEIKDRINKLRRHEALLFSMLTEK